MLNTLYYWVGLIFCWGALAVALYIGCLHLPDRLTEELKDYWLWVRTYVLRHPRFMKEAQVEILMRFFQRPRKLAQWKRNLLAYTIRYSKAKGWKPETE